MEQSGMDRNGKGVIVVWSEHVCFQGEFHVA